MAKQVSVITATSRTICRRFRQTRKDAGLTQVQFARVLKISESYVKGVEQERFTPAHTLIALWARKFNKSVDWIYGLTKE